MQNTNPSPADMQRRHNEQKLRKMVAEDALNLRSTRAAHRTVHTVQSDDYGRPAPKLAK